MRPGLLLRTLALLLSALALASCGPDDTETSDGRTDDTGEDTQPPPNPPQAGCDEQTPLRIENTGELANYFTVCVDQARTRARIKNVSTTVLRANGDGGSEVSMTVTPASSSTPQGELFGEAMGTECTDPSSGPCRLLPGASLHASGELGALQMRTDLAYTALASTVSGVAGSVVSKLQTPGQGYAKGVRDCAEAMANNSQPSVYLEDTIRRNVAYASECGGLFKQVANETSDPPPPPAQTADDIMRNMGRRYTSNLRKDFGISIVTRVLGQAR